MHAPGREHGRRAALLVLVCVLAVACTGRSPPASERDRPPVGAWPTHGWRTAAPRDMGVDPVAVAGIDDGARLTYPALRSVLVVRHGALVVERYDHGATPASAEELRASRDSRRMVGDLVVPAVGD